MNSEVYKNIKDRCEFVFKKVHKLHDEDIIYDAIISISIYYLKNESKIIHFNKWLNGAIHHHYCNYLNSKNKQIFINIDEISDILTESDFNDDYQERVNILNSAVQTLSDLDNEYIQLRFYENKSYAFLSIRYNKSEVAIRKQISRIIKKISKLIK